MSAIVSQPLGPVPPAPPRAAVFLDIERAIGYTGDEAATRELLQMVEQSLASDVAMIAQHIEAGDLAAACRLMHAIKGFVPIFCCDLLIERVTYAEAMSRSHTTESFKPVFADLAPDLMALRQDIGAYLGRPGGAGGGSSQVAPP